MQRFWMAAGAAAMLWAAPASSAIIQVSGNFFATGIQPFSGSVPAPFGSAAGQFKMQYDDQVPGSGALLSFSMALGATHYDRFNTGTIWHSLTPPSIGDRRIRFGGLLNGIGSGTPGSDDFAVGLDFDGSTWLSGFITYNSSLVSPSSGTSSFSAGSESFQPGNFTASVQVSEAPVPGAAVMMSSAAGLLAFAGWNRKRRQRAAGTIDLR